LGMVAFLVFAGSPKDSMVTSPATESTMRSMSTPKIPRAARGSLGWGSTDLEAGDERRCNPASGGVEVAASPGGGDLGPRAWHCSLRRPELSRET
jgi:hypothetical protein